MFDLDDDSALRRLCYFTAFLLVFVPLFQSLGGVWPLGFGNVRWRLSATGTFIQNMQLPFMGLVLMLAIARASGDRTISRGVGVVSALCTVAVVVAVGLFALDSLQVRAIVRTAEMAAYNVAVARVGFALLVYVVAFAVVTFVAFRPREGQQKPASKGSRKSAPDESVGFLIGQDMSK
jgi:hypothetical protein